MKYIGQVFKERLILQLDHDLNLTESQEVKLRQALGDIVLTRSNNDKKIIGTINHHVENLKYNNYGGGFGPWDEVEASGILNDYFVGAKILAKSKRSREFFRPIDLMGELINS